MLARLKRLKHRVGPAPEISIAHEFQKPPYGGANQFLLALRRELRERGWRVDSYRIGRRTRACIVNAWAFNDELIRRTRHEGCTIVHRVDGPAAAYRGVDDGSDERLAELNGELANVTVLQSRYSLEAHEQLGIELRHPVVIPNAVDAAIFHPEAERKPIGGRKVRLIATSWSDNPNKGVETVQWLDRNLDASEYELTFVGRLRGTLEQGRVLTPVDSQELSALLRAHDVYLAPSRNDPCSNALLEALACGLPAIYLRSGGHPELVGEGGLGFESCEEIPGLLERLLAEYEERRARIAVTPLSDVADRYLVAAGLQPRL